MPGEGWGEPTGLEECVFQGQQQSSLLQQGTGLGRGRRDVGPMLQGLAGLAPRPWTVSPPQLGCCLRLLCLQWSRDREGLSASCGLGCSCGLDEGCKWREELGRGKGTMARRGWGWKDVQMLSRRVARP